MEKRQQGQRKLRDVQKEIKDKNTSIEVNHPNIKDELIGGGRNLELEQEAKAQLDAIKTGPIKDMDQSIKDFIQLNLNTKNEDRQIESNNKDRPTEIEHKHGMIVTQQMLKLGQERDLLVKLVDILERRLVARGGEIPILREEYTRLKKELKSLNPS